MMVVKCCDGSSSNLFWYFNAIYIILQNTSFPLISTEIPLPKFWFPFYRSHTPYTMIVMIARCGRSWCRKWSVWIACSATKSAAKLVDALGSLGDMFKSSSILPAITILDYIGSLLFESIWYVYSWIWISAAMCLFYLGAFSATEDDEALLGIL